jgi:hypothetical protein
MKISRPAIAAGCAPETGASTISKPAVAAAAFTALALSMSMVEQSIRMAPGRTCFSTPSRPS